MKLKTILIGLMLTVFSFGAGLTVNWSEDEALSAVYYPSNGAPNYKVYATNIWISGTLTNILWKEVAHNYTADEALSRVLVPVDLGGGVTSMAMSVNISDTSLTGALDDVYLNKSGDTAGSLTVTNLIALSAQSLPWGTVARYSGNNVYFTNSVWAALKQAIDGDTIIYNGNFVEPFTLVAYSTSPMTSAREDLSIIGIGNSLIDVVITNHSSGNECAMDLSGISNLYINNFNLRVRHIENNNPSTYTLWLSSCQKAVVENSTIQAEVYGSGNTQKTVVSVNNATNVLYKDCNIITVDMTGSNIVWHGATHNAQYAILQNCSFIGTTNLYMVGDSYYDECRGNVLSGWKVLPLPNRNMYSALLGNQTEVETIYDMLPNLGNGYTYDTKFTDENVFMIAPAFVDIVGVQGDTLSDVPDSFNGTVILYSGEYAEPRFRFWENANIKIVGVGKPVIRTDSNMGTMFNCCTNITYEIHDVKGYSTHSSRSWLYTSIYCQNVTGYLFNSQTEILSTDDSVSGPMRAVYGSGCKGYIIGGTLLTKNGLNYSVYGSVYNNVDTYTNSYSFPAGTLRNNVLTSP